MMAFGSARRAGVEVGMARRRLAVAENRSDDAFSTAVAELHGSLARFAYTLCGDTSRAEEVVAEAYAKVWPRWRRGQVEFLPAYLRRAVANEAYGRGRRRAVEERHAARAVPPGPDGTFEAQVDAHDALWQALGGLPDPQRVVVVLRVVEDLSVEETADMLGVAVGTVKSRLARGLASLRDILESSDV
jgi:RNA polymerase sigma-70 factor (sigma-E family)